MHSKIIQIYTSCIWYFLAHKLQRSLHSQISLWKSLLSYFSDRWTWTHRLPFFGFCRTWNKFTTRLSQTFPLPLLHSTNSGRTGFVTRASVGGVGIDYLSHDLSDLSLVFPFPKVWPPILKCMYLFWSCNCPSVAALCRSRDFSLYPPIHFFFETVDYLPCSVPWPDHQKYKRKFFSLTPLTFYPLLSYPFGNTLNPEWLAGMWGEKSMLTLIPLGYGMSFCLSSIIHKNRESNTNLDLLACL